MSIYLGSTDGLLLTLHLQKGLSTFHLDAFVQARCLLVFSPFPSWGCNRPFQMIPSMESLLWHVWRCFLSFLSCGWAYSVQFSTKNDKISVSGQKIANMPARLIQYAQYGTFSKDTFNKWPWCGKQYRFGECSCCFLPKSPLFAFVGAVLNWT